MMHGTRNVGRRLKGRRESAAIEAGSRKDRRAAVATTNKMSIKPSEFHRK